MRQVLVALLLVAFAQGHEGHDGPAKGETIQQYAQRHVCLLARDVQAHILIVYTFADVQGAPYVGYPSTLVF